MTHEQKPESAEFRTRREDREQEIATLICKARGGDPFQMTYHTVEPGVMEPFGDAWCHYRREAKAVLDWHEAEARGAAEQRRKDAEGVEEWRPMGTAPKDGTPILAKTVSTPETFGNIRSHWNGRFVVVQHEGITASGFDLRWRVACPVGFGGIPDEWFEGWRPVDRTANVAALEARVKELEGVNKAWSGAAANALTWLENGRQANARDELKAAQRRAAAIREGGE
ncbi:hypothetical protein ABHV46_11000 [Asaia sp. BMEF1]|uniref:hypothetical protein n=1 Tax=Asaia sp. BMEF1 TaxID=3155932 RepID=UPI003F677FB0